MSKKNFYIILITLAILLIIGGLVWYLFFRPKSQPAPTSSINFTVPGQTKSETNLKVISGSPIVSAHLDSFDILWYYDYSGQLWEFSSNDSEPVAISQAAAPNLAEIIWSTNAKNILKSGIGQADNFYTISDPSQKSLFNLKTDTKSAAFSPDSAKIIYYISDNQNVNSLFTSASDGKNQRALIAALKLRDIILAWPKTNQISFTSKPSGTAAGNFWNLDIKNLIFTKTLSDFFGLETLWSPDGNNLLYSFTDQNGRNPKLAILDNKGNRKNLNNVSTLIDKCTWLADSITIICAIPSSWPGSMVLPDDYYKRASLTADDIWKINTQTEEKKLIASGLGDVTNILIRENENALFLILRDNQFLYRLNLK